ncbi:peptidylprolyl isomerase [Trichocoleus desertorum AS-A10]|uniref:peptidylprolyl isomerase n=1 Tax=Trichocoleus desertorum TaxID=1481672 RepID=UPI003297A343
MTVILQVGERAITAAEILPLLARYQLLPQLLRELLLDQVITPYTCTSEETAQACQQFYAQNQLGSEAVQQAWLSQRQITSEEFEARTERGLRIEKFKQATWGIKLESYFLQRKGQMDKVIYSLIRTQDVGIAQELYFRVQEGEQSFADLAREYSQGPEAQTGGLIGPVELSTPHPQLAKVLAMSQPGQLWPPTQLGEWVVIVRLEKFIPAQLDEPMRQRLLNELFNNWLQEQLNQINSANTLGTVATSAS